MLLKRILAVFKKYKQYEIDENKKISLDLILSQANPLDSLENRLEWIRKLVRWIRSVELFDIEPEKIPNAKLKYLFMVLDRNQAMRIKVQNTLILSLQELSSVEFFCEVGLPSQIGLLGEFFEKIISKILPKRPIGYQLSEMMIALFPNEEDVLWLRTLDDGTLESLTSLFVRDKNDYPHLKSDMEDSLIYLISQIVAIGLSPGIRKRIPHKKMKSLPFFYLTGKLNLYLKTKNENLNPELAEQLLNELQDLLQQTEESILEVYRHLNQFGVSTHLVFQLERMKLFLSRAYSLIDLVHFGHLSKTPISHFIAEMVEQNLRQKNAMNIFSNNATLLAQKIIENNSQTGEHYIAKDKREYWLMVVSAIGGGALTAFTVFIKNFLSSLPVNNFLYGALASLNYAGSFLLIQFSGFTLATKQPAATASALAQKLISTENLKGIEDLTDEIVLLTRTQIAAVLGNLLAVIPMVLLINFIFISVYEKSLLSLEAAQYTMLSTDILGPSIFYAIFTGFLLWLSSVFAGWVHNWYTFHQLNFLIINNKKINTVLGKDGAKKFAHFFDHGITGFAGNISLGIFLGLLPELLKFVGIPLEVRHVTLSTGALAASVPTLGIEIFSSPEFARAVIGIAFIGFLNISVSFLLSLYVAFRAKKISTHRKALILRSVLKRFSQKPFSFVIPKSST